MLVVALLSQSFTVYGTEGTEADAPPSYRELGTQFADTIAQATKEGCNALFKSRTELNRMLGGLRVDAREIERVATLAQRIEMGGGGHEAYLAFQTAVREIEARRKSTVWVVIRATHSRSPGETKAFHLVSRTLIYLQLTIMAIMTQYMIFKFFPDEDPIFGRLLTSFLLFPTALVTATRWRSVLFHAQTQRTLRHSRTEMLREFAEGYRARMTELGLEIDQRIYRALRNGNLARAERVLGLQTETSAADSATQRQTARVRVEVSETNESSESSAELENEALQTTATPLSSEESH